MTTQSPAAEAPAERGQFSADVREHTAASAIQDYLVKIRSGDLGALPAVLGLVALFILFSALRPETFPSPLNMANLLLQAMSITLLALGLVFVLLIGEIDLSAGVASGASAAVMATALADAGLPWFAAAAGAILTGVVIGAAIGAMVVLVGIPSFVVSLAFFLGLQGITLWLIGQGGSIPVRDEVISAVANENLPLAAGWVLCALCVLAYAGAVLYGWSRKRAGGLARDPLPVVIGKAVAVGLLIIGATALLSVDRAPSPTVFLGGVPVGVPVVLAFLLAAGFVLTRTRFGRHIYAVGGNAEAARRAGINVARVRFTMFVICSGLAAVSGIVAAARIGSVAPDAGGGNTLLYAVGAAVIGGVSLFGGRGRVVAALLGGLVISVIANGLGLIGLPAFANFLITGGVLLVAASVDALARRRRQAAGR